MAMADFIKKIGMLRGKFYCHAAPEGMGDDVRFLHVQSGEDVVEPVGVIVDGKSTRQFPAFAEAQKIDRRHAVKAREILRLCGERLFGGKIPVQEYEVLAFALLYEPNFR